MKWLFFTHQSLGVCVSYGTYVLFQIIDISVISFSGFSKNSSEFPDYKMFFFFVSTTYRELCQNIPHWNEKWDVVSLSRVPGWKIKNLFHISTHDLMNVYRNVSNNIEKSSMCFFPALPNWYYINMYAIWHWDIACRLIRRGGIKFFFFIHF